MHCIMFGLSIITVQVLVADYHIFCEINVAHKELIVCAMFYFIFLHVMIEKVARKQHLYYF